ncbi:MAG: ATP-binding cassette domain-containing protein [Thermodesulfovibrionales bacterium]|nr:ATP-binding cassette domain-containing protein [Thermodesulfovibrionales bacterium]
MPIIKVENLTKKFGNIAAVNNISFDVDEGTIFGFLGPNGAGKTTTISILCTLLGPTSGNASVNGYDCTKESSSVRKSIGIVFQDTTLDKDLTAEENLLFHAYLYNVEKSERRKRVDDVLRLVDLFSRKDDLVKKFSGGMKRRLEVARGLIHRPKVLFLDEPTLGLDPQSRTNLWEFITALPEKYGVTIFMTTHYMDEAEVCDNIAIIDNGSIIAMNSPEELKKVIGGDVIYLKTKDNEKAREAIKSLLDLEASIRDGELFISTVKGDTCIPELIRILGSGVLSVRLQRPTLNDVFLKLTGKAIRDAEGADAGTIKAEVRAYRRRHE